MDYRGSLGRSHRPRVLVREGHFVKEIEEIQRLRYEADKRMCEGYDEAFARYTSGDASALDGWEMEVEEAEEDEVVAAQPDVRKSRVV